MIAVWPGKARTCSTIRSQAPAARGGSLSSRESSRTAKPACTSSTWVFPATSTPWSVSSRWL